MPIVHLQVALGNIECAVKHTKDVDVSVIPDQVRDPIVPVEQDSHMTR
jgi:hypothetical protein